MKIVMVFDGLEVGGITKVGADYVSLFTKNGYDVSIINLRPHKKGMINAFDQECHFYNFSYRKSFVYQRYAPLNVYGILGSLAYVSVSAVLWIINLFYKLVARIRFRKLCNTDILIAFSGHYNDLSFVANRYINSKKKGAWIHGTEFEYKVISDGYFNLFRQIRNIVCLSDAGDITCKKFNEKNKINKCKIYNPIDISHNEVNENKVNALKSTFGDFALMIGRLGEDKDQETVIKAVKMLKDKYSFVINLLLVGDGPKKTVLETLSSELGVSEQIIFVGQRNDVQNYYSAAKIFVHSSPMEGLPTVLLEAMSYGIPIASTDSFPGVKEILGSNDYGLVSPIYDAEALGENMYKLLKDPALSDFYVNAGKSRVKDFSSDAAIRSVQKFLME